MRLCAATHDDVPRIREIRADVRESRLEYPEKASAADVHAFIDRCGVRLCRDAGDRIVGFAAGDVADGSAWALFVDPGHEHRGIGQAPIAKTCEALRTAGDDTATLSTEPGSRAEGFYAANGSSRGGMTARGEVIFSKPL
jgi:GNAT superfamily N-acetyltransferase